MRMLVILLALSGAPGGVAAQAPVTLDPAAVLSLAEEPWRDRDGFAVRLSEVLGGFRADPEQVSAGARADDPMLWSITGEFGAPLAGGVPGGIVVCSRYGLATRDRLAATRLSDPGAFALLGVTNAAPDDAAVWPEAGIARLSCMITWDDTRRVAIIGEDASRGALRAHFAEIARSDDRTRYGANWREYAPLFGDEGFRLDASGGPRSSTHLVESALIELRVSHQRINFRAFLLTGGV